MTEPVPAELPLWLLRVVTALELSDEDLPDVPTLLDLTREVAHQVTRPAGPLTCYLLGVAAAHGQDPADAVAQVRALLAK
ncbi:MAG: DUF6457 domain-containing protein [Micrococcales bacterium]|nr:DUF6457 domain-containing protein [Micrococcales bacterium]MCL2667435.1 DUF6457 domain-containing protein [Micrococcales bacterium]